MNHKINGLTLIELLIAIAIIAVLTAVAYPSYTAFVKSSNRTEAQRELLRFANLQEQYFVDHRVYTANMADLEGVNDPHITEHGWYKIDATLSNGSTSFTLTATAIGLQADDTHCATLTVTDLGVKGGTSNDCWD